MTSQQDTRPYLEETSLPVRSATDGHDGAAVGDGYIPKDERLALWFWGELGTGITTTVLMITQAVIQGQGYNKYHFQDWDMLMLERRIYTSVILSILLSVANLVRLGFYARRPLPALVNTVLFGYIALWVLYSTICAVLYWPLGGPAPCPGGPNDEPFMYDESFRLVATKAVAPETYKSCLEWLPIYRGVTFTLVAVVTIHALVSGVIFILELVEIVRLKVYCDKTEGAESGFDKGQMVVDLRIRWDSWRRHQQIRL